MRASLAGARRTTEMVVRAARINPVEHRRTGCLWRRRWAPRSQSGPARHASNPRQQPGAAATCGTKRGATSRHSAHSDVSRCVLSGAFRCQQQIGGERSLMSIGPQNTIVARDSPFAGTSDAWANFRRSRSNGSRCRHHDAARHHCHIHVRMRGCRSGRADPFDYLGGAGPLVSLRSVCRIVRGECASSVQAI
jgi:hypothetical protein